MSSVGSTNDQGNKYLNIACQKLLKVCHVSVRPPSYPASSFPLTSGRERTTLERSDLKSENSGLPVELRMPTVHDLFGRE